MRVSEVMGTERRRQSERSAMLVSTAPTRSRNCYRGNAHIDSATPFPSLYSHTALLTLRRSVTLQQPKPKGLETRMRRRNRNNCQSRYHPSSCQSHHLRSMNWASSCAGHSQEHRDRQTAPRPPALFCPDPVHLPEHVLWLCQALQCSD